MGTVFGCYINILKYQNWYRVYDRAVGFGFGDNSDDDRDSGV